MLWSQTVVDQKSTPLRRACDSGDHRAMRIDRAHYVAAAMQVENGPVERRSRWRYPFGAHVADAHRFAGHVGCDPFADLLHTAPHLADGGIRISWLRLDDVEYLGEQVAKTKLIVLPSSKRSYI